ncbi:MAG: DUF3488 domain-containing protein [Nitrospinae bacterium]|nr:DUF3488 domain-containing protein [Nitrospinota bacterium]
MSAPYQIPRISLAWLLASMGVVILPHVVRLPLWITITCSICLIWRILVFQGKWSYPHKHVKSLIAFAGALGIIFSYGTLVLVEAFVALLVLAFAFKLLEMHKRRDALLVIYLAYFVAITEFIFEDSIPVALYVSFGLTTVTAALIGLNQNVSYSFPWKTFRLSSILLLQSIPLMIAMFILFPRIAPLWSVPLPDDSAKTGLSDTVSLGDIASLSQSDELAFRVTFNEKIPEKKNLYWRGIAFHHFDGRTWSQGKPEREKSELVRWFGRENRWKNSIQKISGSVRYSVIIEKTNQPWLFALNVPDAMEFGIGLTRDFRLIYGDKVKQRFQYKVTSTLEKRLDKELPDWLKKLSLQLPEQGNERARTFAVELRKKSATTGEFINSVLTMYNRESFRYTLRPPLLGGNTIDEFLFDTKAGFCAHFAGSFVFLMRAAGVPARMVGGYQGGEINPHGNYVLVHQFDAHAWAEVWLEGEGWLRFDPTAFVAPERIESGLERAMSTEGSFLEGTALSLLKFRDINLINNFRLWIDMMNYNWNRWVLGYTPSLQLKVMQKFLGEVSWYRVGLALFFSSTLIIVFLGLLLLRKESKAKKDPATKLYLNLCQKLSKHGVQRNIGEAPFDFAKRVSREIPELSNTMQEITQLFVQLKYEKNIKKKDLRSNAAFQEFSRSVAKL